MAWVGLPEPLAEACFVSVVVAFLLLQWRRMHVAKERLGAAEVLRSRARQWIPRHAWMVQFLAAADDVAALASLSAGNDVAEEEPYFQLP